MNDFARRMLSVDFSELCIALAAEGDLRWFFDLRTGDVILVNQEYDPEDNGGVTVAEIEGNPHRFVRVPAVDPQTIVSDMKAWMVELTDGQLKESLEIALAAPRPERRFKAVLAWLPAMQEAWHTFRSSRSEQRARDWLSAHGVDATPRAPEPSES